LAKKLAGEEKNEAFYSTIDDILNFTAQDKNLIKEKEISTILKLLKSSGFLKEETHEIEELSKDTKKATEIINHSLKMAGI
jgi:ABC-type uncharacterized transport system ATPase subunit